MKLPWYWKVGIVVLALAFAYFVWPGRYEYMAVGERLIRIDRFTGQPEITQSVDAPQRVGQLIWVGGRPTQRRHGDVQDPFEEAARSRAMIAEELLRKHRQDVFEQEPRSP